MGQKIAVAIIHGIGRPDPGFADGLMEELRRGFRGAGAEETELVMKPVYWSPVLQGAENELWRRTQKGGPMDFTKLRRFMMDFAADAIAYQPLPKEKKVYDAVHQVVAQAFRALAEEAGPKAPLCVIAHSLGTVIASNYLYDMEAAHKKRILPKTVTSEMEKTPLEKGETLSNLYTLGSPIALWSLRYADFGSPVNVPSIYLKKHWPGLAGEWVNYYDEDDVIGYPLKTVNRAYAKAVKEDRAVSIGNFFTGWTPASHSDYWTDNSVTKPMAQALAELWRKVNL
jgi:hypothetical protein